jgi:hypothetical protein
MKKLGKKQQEVYNYIVEHNGTYISDVYNFCTPFVHSAQNIHGHFNWSAIRKILDQLEKYNLIKIENRGRTDCIVYIK